MNFIDYLNLPACVRLTIALAHFLWQGLAFALLTVIAAKLFGSQSSRIRYIAYVTCLFGMVIALCMTYTLVDVPAKSIAEESFFEAESIPAKSQLVVSTSEPTLPRTIEPVKISSVESASDIEAPKPVTLTRLHSSIDLQHYVPYAASLYFLGVIVMLGRLLIGLQGGQRLRKFSQPVGDPVVVAALARQARELGMVFTPAIAYCKRVMVPTVVGILKPAILLPFSFASGLSPLQVEMLLTHELAHIHRYDPLINVIQKIVEALLFFHPAVWFISHRARIERENCCDDIVVGAEGKAAEYAASLVKMAEKMMVSKQGVLVEGFCVTGCPSRLKQRILRLTGRPTCQQVRLTNVWAVVLALLVISFFALTTFQGNRPEGTKRDGREVEVRKGPPVQEPKVSVVAKSSGLRAILTAKQLSIMPGKPVVVELYLQNVSEEEIIYVDFKTNFFLDEIELTTLLVDGRLVCMHTLLDVNDDGYKVIAEHKPNNVATEEGVVSYTPLPIPRKAFVVLRPGEKVAYLKVDLQPTQFIHERRKGVLGPLQIPGEHTIQVEYHNRLDGRKFGLSAWTGKVRSNVVTVRVTGDTSPDKLNLEIKNLLSEFKKLDSAHSRIVRQKWEEWRAMSSEERQRITAEDLRGNRIKSFTSGMEKELRTLSEKTARRIMAFGGPAVPILLEELETVPRWFCYYPQCISDSLKWIGSPSVPYLIGALQAPEARHIVLIINVLGLIKDPQAVEPFIELYRSKKSGHRHVIATALGRIGDKRAVEPLIRSLSEPDKKVAVSAARALGMLGDERAVEPLIDLLADSHKELVSAAIGSLADLKDSRAVEPLLRLWDRSDVYDRVKLASALAFLGDKRAAKPIRIALDEMVLKAERTGDWKTNNWALLTFAGALGRLKDKQAIPLLKRMLAAGPQEGKGAKVYVVAEKAAEALRYLGLVVEGENGQYQVFEAPPKVKTLLNAIMLRENEHEWIRWQKIDAMSEQEGRQMYSNNMAVFSGLEKELDSMAKRSAEQIAEFGGPVVPVLIDKFRHRWGSERHHYYRCVKSSLVQIGTPAVPHLIKELQSQHKRRGHLPDIISILGEIKDQRAVEPLLAFWERRDSMPENTKCVIASALGNIGDKRAVEPIIDEFDTTLAQAEQNNEWNRANKWAMIEYARALGTLGDNRAIPVLKKALNAGPQTTKAGKEYLLAEEAATALRSLTSLERESKQIDRGWTGKLGGEVIAPDGKLLADAKVRGYRMRHNHYFFGVDPQAAEPLETVQTDNMGQFVFSTFPTALEVTHKDWPDWKAQIRSRDRKFKVLTMRRGYAVNGSVLNEDGEPIKGVQITLEMHTGVVAAALLWSEFVTLGSVTPEEDGSFLLQGLVPGNKYRLAVYAQGYVRHVTDLFECLGSDTAKLNPIKLARGTALNFTVLSPEGKALPNTLLQISDSSAFSCALDWFCGTGRTDSTGKVTISDLPAGKIWVCVHAEGFLDRKWHRCYYCESDRNVTVVMKGTQHTRARPAEDAGNDIGIGPSQRVLKATSPPEVIVEPSGLESDPLAPMGDMPDDAQKVLKEYFRCVEWGDPELLEEILCFNDERDRELFIAFSSSRGKIYVRPGLFLSGKPIEQKRAAEDCWIVVLDGGYLLELWKVDGKWKVLCPLPGRKRMAEAKLTRAETYRHLLAEEIKQVESESDVQLRRRRQRYLAVLDLSGRHQIKHLAYYFSGIPANDPAILSGMSNEQFRESVILKLDAPDGLRYRVDPEQKALLEGKPVFVTFFMENVTSGNIILEYRPAVEIVDSSNAITARGALVFPRGEKTAELIKSPYRGKLAYPLKKREVKIAPGATFTMRVNLLEYYDLPPARYTISSRIDIDNTGQGYWRGHAMSDTTSFEIMPLQACRPPDPNMAIVAGKVTDTATGKGVAGIPIILGARAVTATLSDGTYRATNVAPGRTSVGARDKDWYLVPHRQGAISAYYNYLQYENVNLEAGKETHLDMQVTKGGKIKGTVRDASGKAVSGTIIWIINQREDDSIVAAETREFGNYTSYGLALGTPLEFLVWTSDGRGSARRTITLEAGEIREVDFILDPENEYRIVGKVSDSSGRGVPNLPMRCWWRERNRRCHRSLHTDENGNFFFSGLEPGMEYEVYAYGKSAGFDTVNKSVRMLANERTVPLYFYLQKREEKPAPTATRKKADVSVGAESYELRISKILQHLYKEMQKAYEDVGLSKEDIQGLLSVQLPQKAIGGKWEAYREAWPAIVKARNAAIEEMASLGPSAVPFLLEAEDKSNERRGADIFVLAITKVGKTAVPVVIDGLSHVNAVVRARAATSLGKMGDSRAVEPLIRSLSDPDKRVVGAAVWSLGLLKDNAATEPLLELWHKEQVDSRTLIASALGQIGDKRAAKPIMVALEEYVSEARQTGNWDINSWAMRVYAGALGQIGDTRAIPLLKRTLRAGPQKTKVGPPKYLVAQEAAQALRSLGVKVQGEKGDYRIIEIAPLLQKPDAINQELPDGARVIYVDADADGANNGSSWIDAYRYLQDALVVARSGDKIRVAQGVYKPDQGKGQAPGDRQRTFRLGQAVVKGGYAGFGSPDPNERDISRFETVLSGDLNGDDEPNFVNTDDNSFRVITTTDDVILDGFIITGGNSDGSGAGMTCVAANATISNCIFRGNAAVHGGAMYISGRKAKRVAGKFIGLSPVLTNCTFVNNSAVYAGAIAINDSSPNFRDCIFVGNSALSLTSSSGIGGAIRNVFSDPNLFNCLFKENSAVRGGAIFNQQSNSIFAQCTFVANSVRIARRTGIGSAIYNTHSNPRLTSCVFSENWPDEAGPIHNHESSPTLTNCKFNGNRGAAEEGVRPAPEPEGVRQQRDYEAARTVPQPIELWKAREYGCGGSPRTALKLRTDVKRRYPILLTWPLIQDASKYVVQIQGLRGSRPARSFESTTNSLRLEKADLVPGRYQWSVSVYDRHGKHIGNIETIDPVEIFAIEDPQPVAANGKRVMIDLNHSAGHIRGWGYYNHAQYITKELLENAGFEVQVNERDLLTREKLKSVDLLICHYYWAGWPGFRPYSKSEISAVRQFVEMGGSLLVVGCDRKDGGGKMSEAGSELVKEFGLLFELDKISEQHNWAEVTPNQNVISLTRPVNMQLPVGVVGENAATLLQFDGVPIVKAKQFGYGKVIVAGVGMSFLDCYLGDFERRESLHLIMFFDFIKYLTGIDWKNNCNKEFVDVILSRCQFQDK